MTHAASHVDDERRVAWVSISMHACDPVPINSYGALFGSPGAPLKIYLFTAITKSNY